MWVRGGGSVSMVGEGVAQRHCCAAASILMTCGINCSEALAAASEFSCNNVCQPNHMEPHQHYNTVAMYKMLLMMFLLFNIKIT